MKFANFKGVTHLSIWAWVRLLGGVPEKSDSAQEFGSQTCCGLRGSFVGVGKTAQNIPACPTCALFYDSALEVSSGCAAPVHRHNRLVPSSESRGYED